MATNFCYCIGGTGARIAEAAAHLCATNMVDSEDNIVFIIVDKDFNCKGTLNARDVISHLSSLSNEDGVIQKSSSEIGGKNKKGEFCRVEMKVEDWSFTNAMKLLNKDLDNKSSIKSALCKSKEDEVLLGALYSEDEQTEDTEMGFYGHPSTGALIFNYMVKFLTKEELWNSSNSAGNIADPVINYLEDKTHKARVFFIGSIFGGTGAAVFSNLAKYIRKTIKDKKENYNDRLYLSGCLLLPYFGFPQGREKDRYHNVNCNDFYIKSQVALDHYGLDKKLVKNNSNKEDYTFDTLYVLGQNPLNITGEAFAKGGDKQKNHFDLIDVLAGRSMIEFFNTKYDDIGSIENEFLNIFEYRLSTNSNDNLLSAPIDYDVLPGIGKPVKTMLAFSVFILSVYADILFKKGNKQDINIIRAITKIKGLTQKSKNEYCEPIYAEIIKPVREVYNYCSTYIVFANDLSKNGKNWDGSLGGNSDSYNLFNSDYLDILSRANDGIESAAAGGLDQEGITAILNDINVLKSQKIFQVKIDNIIDELSSKCNNGKAWSGISAEYQKRASDYIHEAYKCISELVR